MRKEREWSLVVTDNSDFGTRDCHFAVRAVAFAPGIPRLAFLSTYVPLITKDLFSNTPANRKEYPYVLGILRS